MKKHVITALVENRQGVLARIVGLISGRGFNIESLNVAATQDPTVSRLTILVPGDDRVLEQVMKQLNKLIDVIRVADLTRDRFLNRELILVKVAAPPARRAELRERAALAKAHVLARQGGTLTLQLAGTQEEVAGFIALLEPFSILDLSRSGIVAVARDEAAGRRARSRTKGGRGEGEA